MYPKYRCMSCDNEVLAFKTVHLEEGTIEVCSVCYYTALEKNGRLLMTLDELKSTQVNEETYKRTRMNYINLLRRYINKHQKVPYQVLEDFAKEEINLAMSKYNKSYKDLNLLEKHNIINILQAVKTKEYFKDFSTQESLKDYQSIEYFKVSDYNNKLNSILKNM